MAYKTNEVIKSELEALSIAYDDDMTNSELQARLDSATDAPDAPSMVGLDTNLTRVLLQAPEVPLGVSTINDHEKRIFALEQVVIALGELIEANRD
jgi:hypothetical protein